MRSDDPDRMPWLDVPLALAVAAGGHHAWLVHGPGEVGQFELASALAEAWLCEDDSLPLAQRPCGRCVACRLLRAGTHPDLLVVMPQAMREAIGRDVEGEGGEGEGGAGKRKPSKQIRIEDILAANAFASTTSARRRAKVVVVHPAERMNPIAANAFLKTLEEPPGGARFVLTSGAVDALPPTIRSRCQAFALALPPPAAASAWLEAHGVADAPTQLAAAGGRPADALARARQGIDAAAWRALPGRVAAGDARGLEGWPLPWVVDALLKLSEDAVRVANGVAPRFFAGGDVPAAADVAAVVRWSRELATLARDVEHPWHAGLAVEALVQRGREALQTPRPSPLAARA